MTLFNSKNKSMKLRKLILLNIYEISLTLLFHTFLCKSIDFENLKSESKLLKHKKYSEKIVK